MVLLENIINNIKRKINGRPGDIQPTCIYYCSIEEDQFTGVGDCIILESDQTVIQGERIYNELESKSMIPIWLVPHSILPSELSIRYTSFFLPNHLKVNLSGQRLENNAGLVFNE